MGAHSSKDGVAVEGNAAAAAAVDPVAAKANGQVSRTRASTATWHRHRPLETRTVLRRWVLGSEPYQTKVGC